MFYWIWETCYRADLELIVGSVGNSILCWTWYLASFYRGEWRQIMNVNLFDWVDLKESLGGTPQGTLSHMSSKSHIELYASVIHSLWLLRQEITIYFCWSHWVSLSEGSFLLTAHSITDAHWCGFSGSFLNPSVLYISFGFSWQLVALEHSLRESWRKDTQDVLCIWCTGNDNLLSEIWQPCDLYTLFHCRTEDKWAVGVIL